ncbi:MAG: 2-C-methyl-D-erythritol 4-phosphate cytidylyltransferase [Candidatus Cyclobacteriaceae bacterium M2_1C_046]
MLKSSEKSEDFLFMANLVYMNEYALIVAGGTGTRMKSKVVKQFLPLAGKPVLMHTIEAFKRYSHLINIHLVLPKDQIGHWQELCKTHKFNIPHEITYGGLSRFQSVKNGLANLPGEGLVAIHDGVRPMTNENTIAASFRLASIHGSAVAAVRLKESIRMVDPDKTKAMDRSKYRLIQTPQTFQLSIIKEAYELPDDPSLTDDASVAERAGHQISLFEGTYDNIKITTPEDMLIAEALLQQKNPAHQ